MPIHSVIVKVVERCNLNCAYCYMYNHADQRYLARPRVIPERVFAALTRRLAEYCDARPGHRMVAVLHGGEPMMLDPDVLDRWLVLARPMLQGRVRWLVQTNATLVTDRWMKLMRTHDMACGLSLDGPQEIHDSMRVDHRGRGTYSRTLDGIVKLRAGGFDANVLCVINPTASGAAVYRHFLKLGIKRMNFLFPDVSHDAKPTLYGERGTGVGRFLVAAFDEWFDDDDPEVYVHVFVELIRIMFGAESGTDTFGNRPENYLVVDTDGSILANDALKVCFDGAAESGLNVLEHSFEEVGRRGRGLCSQLLTSGIKLAEECRSCPEVAICGGGAVPHRYSKVRGFENPSVWCEDIKLLISHVRTRLGERGVTGRMNGQDLART